MYDSNIYDLSNMVMVTGPSVPKQRSSKRPPGTCPSKRMYLVEESVMRCGRCKQIVAGTAAALEHAPAAVLDVFHAQVERCAGLSLEEVATRASLALDTHQAGAGNSLLALSILSQALGGPPPTPVDPRDGLLGMHEALFRSLVECLLAHDAGGPFVAAAAGQIEHAMQQIQSVLQAWLEPAPGSLMHALRAEFDANGRGALVRRLMSEGETLRAIIRDCTFGKMNASAAVSRLLATRALLVRRLAGLDAEAAEHATFYKDAAWVPQQAMFVSLIEAFDRDVDSLRSFARA